MASNFNLSSEVQAELQCSICQDNYDEPVTIACGHNFCRNCLMGVFEKSWKNGVNEYGQPEMCIDCAICRQPYFTTHEKIETMCVNLSLRNIVSAINDSIDDALPMCEKHDLPCNIYCLDCKSAECLNCFVISCGKNSHEVSDLNRVASEIRQDLKGNLNAVEEDMERLKKLCEGDDSEVMKLRTLAKQLLSMTEKLEKVESQVLAQEIETGREWTKQVKILTSMPSPSLIASKDKMEALVPPRLNLGKNLSAFHGDCSSLAKNVKQNIDSLQEVFNVRGFGLGETEETNDEAVLPPDHFGDLDRRTSSSQSDVSEESLYSIIPIVSEQFEEPVIRIEYPNIYINSVSAMPSFVLNTDVGCTYTNNGSHAPWFLTGQVVSDLCLIGSTGHALAIVDNKIQVHDNAEILELRAPRYILPTPTMNNPCQFECIGATNGEEIFYVASDIENSCIHLWNSVQSCWCSPIEMMPHFTEFLQPSFKMCAFEERVYVTFHNESLVFSFSLSGSVFWINESCRRPNGLTVNERGVFVCEGELGNHCVTILNLDGTFRQSILSDLLERPWSIAIRNDQLAVLERFYQHNIRNGPMIVSLFTRTYRD